MMGVLGFILGMVLFVFGIFPYLSGFGFNVDLPSTLVGIFSSPPAMLIQIGLIVGGFFLWIDAARRSRVFNGLVSIIVGAIAIAIGAIPLLVSFGVISFFIDVPYNIIQFITIILGILLIIDSIPKRGF